MLNESDASITEWIAHLRAGDPRAAQKLWERYFAQLIRLARARLRPRGDIDGEDVALSAFDSFCQAVEQGRFPQLADRNDLWRLLVFITARKISKVIAREQTQIRGGSTEVAGGAALVDVLAREPSPDFATEIAETFREVIDSLGEEELRRVAVWKMEGYTNEEIAVRLGHSLKTVSNRLKLIRLKLEKRYSER